MPVLEAGSRMAVGRGCTPPHPGPGSPEAPPAHSVSSAVGEEAGGASHIASLAAPGLGEHVGRRVLAGRAAWWCLCAPRICSTAASIWRGSSSPNLASLWVSTFTSLKWVRGSEDSPKGSGTSRKQSPTSSWSASSPVVVRREGALVKGRAQRRHSSPGQHNRSLCSPEEFTSFCPRSC